MVGSAKKTNEVAKISEIYLSPPTDNFKMLDYDNLEKITEVGYKYAVEELNKYDLNQIINSWAYAESGRSELIFGSYLKYIVDKKDMMKYKIMA